MKEVLAAITMIVLIVAMLVGLALVGFEINSYFAPKYEALRRDVMIESRAYTEATISELYQYRRQFDAATTNAERTTILAAVRHTATTFPKERLPADLQEFVGQAGI